MKGDAFTSEGAGAENSRRPLWYAHRLPGYHGGEALRANARKSSEISHSRRTGLGIIVETHVVSDHPAGALPVILVPGLGLSAKYMLPLAKSLSETSDVWILEVKRAATAHSRGCLHVREAGSLVIEWMAKQGMASAVLGGHSFGAQVVAAAAIQDPSRVQALVLIAPTVDPAARTIVAQAWRLLRDSVREPFSAVWLATADYLKHPANVFRMARAAVEDDIQSRLPAVRCPTRVLCGSRDPVVPGNWARTVAALLPQGELVTINGAAHALPYSHWQEIAAEIRRAAGCAPTDGGSVLRAG